MFSSSRGLRAALLALPLLGLAACVVEPPPRRAAVEVVAPGAPPPVRYEPPPPPPPGQVELVVWDPGHWRWNGQWVWVAGRYVRQPNPGARWVAGRWAQRGDGSWIWIEGRWR